MLTKQFQDEATVVDNRSRITRFVADETLESGREKAVILPLVIRLLVNGWITDKEKVFLDAQAPEDCLTFLINGRDYIHPEGVDLFPFDVIETTSLHGGEAIFSHRYLPHSMTESYQPYRIFSAAINPKDTDKVILGFFGPAHRLGTINEDSGFSKLVQVFRDCFASVKEDVSGIRQALEREQGTLLVNRTTGRTLALNDSASNILNRSDRSIVDISLDQLKYHLKPLLPMYNLKMENIAAADIGLSVVMLEPGRIADRESHGVLASLSKELVSGAARIGLLTERLTDTVGNGTKGAPSLAQTIRQEALRMNLAARQQAFVLNRARCSLKPQNIQKELLSAADRMTTRDRKEPVVTGDEDVYDFRLDAPDGAFSILFETILDDHLRPLDTGCESRVNLAPCGDSSLRIHFETTLCRDSLGDAFKSHNEQFMTFMTELLKVELIKNCSIDDNKIVTELIVKQ